MTRTFIAKNDKGISYRVLEVTQMINCDSSDGPAVIPGWKTLKLLDGTHVNRNGKGKYETYDGMKLHSDEPLAP